MTREEALKIIQPIMSSNLTSAERAIEVFVALGFFKYDKSQPDLLMDKLENELRKRYFHDNEMISLKQAIKNLDLEIVEKTKR